MANFDLEGLLSNPAFQMGLGILANNNTQNTAQVLGRGGLMGLQNAQQQKQWERLNEVRQSQVDVMSRRQDREDKAFEMQQKAVEEASAKYPEQALLFQLDPQAAIRALYPQVNQSDPYFQAVATDSGLGKFNARTGEFELVMNPATGKPYIKSADSPTLQGNIAGAKARETGRYSITDKIPGMVTTETNAANLINGGLPPDIPRLPQGQPNPWQIPPEVQAQRDAKAKELIAAEGGQGNMGITPPMPYNLPTGGGIRVPTKPEEAAAVEKAKADAEFNSPEATKKREMANEFKKTTAQNVINAIDGVMERVDGWSAGVGGNLMRKAPFNNDAKDIVADLETVKANFGFDRLQTMRDMSPTGGALGQVAVQELTALQASVANLSAENQSPEQLKRNLEKAKTHYKNWLDTLEGKTPDTGKSTKRTREDILKEYGISK